MKIWIVIGLICALVVGFFILQRIFHTRKIKAQQQYEHVVTRAFQAGLNQVQTPNFTGKDIDLAQVQVLHVAQVWGLNVVVYGYALPLDPDSLAVNEVIKIKSFLVGELNRYAAEENLPHADNTAPFVISDIWSREHTLHIEIAYVINASTEQYLHDIKKIDK